MVETGGLEISETLTTGFCFRGLRSGNRIALTGFGGILARVFNKSSMESSMKTARGGWFFL